MSEIIVDAEKLCAEILKSVSSLPQNLFSQMQKEEIRNIIKNVQKKLAKITKSVFIRTGRGRRLGSNIKINASAILSTCNNLPNDPTLKARLNTQLTDLKFSVDTMEREIRRRTIIVT